MKRLILILATVCSACGPKATTIDPDLAHGVARYLAAAPNPGVFDQLRSVTRADLPNGKNGDCARKRGNGVDVPNHYVIRIARWIPEGPILDATVAHEMAHCVHGFHHVDGSNLMDTVLAPKGSDWWESNLDNEIKGLFEKK